MSKSKIEWTDTTWNPVIGCAKVSAGCKNCYAEKQAARILHLNKFTGPYLDVIRGADEELPSRWNGKAVFLPERLADPLRWRKPRRVFVNSMSDLFHEDITFVQIAAVFGVMAATPHLTYQVLTKRAKRMREFFKWIEDDCGEFHEPGDGPRSTMAGQAGWVLGDESDQDAVRWAKSAADTGLDPFVSGGSWPLPNVHLGVSVEDQRAADERIPVLLACPAALRFLSVEPLLGPVNLRHVDADRHDYAGMYQVDTLTGRNRDMGRPCRDVNRIGWVIVGGESGPGARACDVAWIRSIVDQCGEAGVPVFVKQLGACSVDTPVAGYTTGLAALRDRKGGDPDEWPGDLRVRQLPGGA